jgi:cytoskeletal protein RodZ
MENKNLKDFLKEIIETKGLSLKKLHQVTDIPELYLENLLEGKFEKLPAKPYVRGYLLKLARVLELNSDDLWNRYQEENKINASGSADRLPENRFAIKPISKKLLIAGAIGLALILYLIFGVARLTGKPEIVIFSPGAELSLSNNEAATVSGKINPRDILTINQEEIVVDKNGNFRKTYNLQAGLNTFEFSVKRLLGKEIKVFRQIIYQTP